MISRMRHALAKLFMICEGWFASAIEDRHLAHGSDDRVGTWGWRYLIESRGLAIAEKSWLYWMWLGDGEG